MDFDELLKGRRLIAILRGVDVPEALRVAAAVWDSGAGVVEVPVQTPLAFDCLRALAGAAAERGETVGAGTVLDPDLLRRAADAGAGFTVAPDLDPDVLAAARAAGLPHLPGVATASEVHRAVRAGCRWLKAFPASSLGAVWMRDIRGPFPDVKLVATGGVDDTNAAEYLRAGAQAVGVGAVLREPGGVARVVAALG